MASVALKSGDTIWGLVSKKLGPGASNADIAAATNKVLKANGETAASAKTMQVGEKVDLGVLDPKKPAAKKPAANQPANGNGGTPAPAAADPAAPAAPADPGAPLGEAEAEAAAKKQQEILAQLGLSSLPPSLAQLLNNVVATSDPTVSPFLGSLVSGNPANAINVPGRPGVGPTFTGLNNFLNSQAGQKPNNTNALAAASGSFVNQISGINFTAFNPANILAQNPGFVR